MNKRYKVELDSKAASKLGIPDGITSNGKNVEKKFCLFYSLVRGTRTKFNLGYYVARELYEKIYSKGKMAIENTTDKVTRSKDKVARELDIKAAKFKYLNIEIFKC